MCQQVPPPLCPGLWRHCAVTVLHTRLFTAFDIVVSGHFGVDILNLIFRQYFKQAGAAAAWGHCV